MCAAKPKILLVDDCKEDRFLLKQALLSVCPDCEVEEACDGEEAQIYLDHSTGQGTPPNLVILDMFLPKRSGIEVMGTLFAGSLKGVTRVIVLSSILPEEEADKLRKLGACAVLEKPSDLDQFMALGKRLRDLGLTEPAAAISAN